MEFEGLGYSLILAIDVQYDKTNGLVAGVALKSWTDASPSNIYVSKIENVDDYLPGQFYQRELPCIFKLLNEHSLRPEYIVVDGYVYLDGCSKPGLGKQLYDALHGKVKVIGVAKRSYVGISEEYAIFRGSSKKPRYITSAGETLSAAKLHIMSMHGVHRIPTMLKKVDQLCRLNGSTPTSG
ncbi:endonuclease V [Nitrosomonas sp. Nm132]|uniref:endonuclease V n=1 Tax=Nitrosomonas sp. Nm132 TaxID=1881053 RepID=UPI000880E7CB|nr:endonuclease V [Nitrosomonas sp. Nm132]SDH64056.1 deoxyribonuclease V [Nitrosomonas sp. Nm132]